MFDCEGWLLPPIHVDKKKTINLETYLLENQRVLLFHCQEVGGI